MKKIILMMLLGIFPSVLFAQIQVDTIVESPMDLTASTQKRVDLKVLFLLMMRNMPSY